MQHLPDGFPVSPPAPGSHLLGLSPPFLGLQGVTNRYLASGLDAGDGCVLVTTTDGVESTVAAVSDHADREVGDRLGIVDATTREGDPSAVPCRVETVPSPADLTGIGIALNKLLEAHYESDVEGYRVVVDSVSALLVYAGFDRVYKFLHTVTTQIDGLGGTSITLLAADTEGTDVHRLEGLFDGVVEVRDADDGPQYRVSGHEGMTDWRSFERVDGTAPPDLVDAVAPADASTAPDASTTPDAAEIGLESPNALAEIVDAVERSRLALTLVNDAGDGDRRASLREYFERLNVDVRTASLSTEEPRDVALLHKGSDVFATSALSDLHTAIEVGTIETGRDLQGMAYPDVLEEVHRDEYSVQDGSKREMVRISRLIERRALGAGRGTLHAGFQRLDRLDDEFHTRDVYEAIAETDVTVHLYGEPGSVPNEELYTLHPAESGELSGAWFVVYDGGGADALKAAELCEETAPSRYSGFWTHRPAVVDAVTSYLDSTYGSSP